MASQEHLDILTRTDVMQSCSFILSCAFFSWSELQAHSLYNHNSRHNLTTLSMVMHKNWGCECRSDRTLVPADDFRA